MKNSTHKSMGHGAWEEVTEKLGLELLFCRFQLKLTVLDGNLGF
jgi:hypothetical protein